MSLTGPLIWSFLSELATKAVAPVVLLVMVQLLTPADFGVVAAAAMVVGFCQIFWAAGIANAVVQYAGAPAPAADAAFWINLLLGALVSAGLYVSAGAIADFVFQDARVAPVLQLMSVQVLLSAVVSVHTALLQKNMHFKRLFWIRLVTVAVPGLVSIPLALQGWSYWALVWGALIGQAAQTVVLWFSAHWVPRLRFDPQAAMRLLRFGSWAALTSLLGWFYLWADAMIVGIWLGPKDLGLFRTGNQLMVMLYALAIGSFMPVLYSHLSKLQNVAGGVQTEIARVVRIISVVVLPATFLAAANAALIADTLFGVQWDGIATVILVMALVHGFSWLVGANGEAYRAIGRPSVESRISLFCFPIYLGGYLLTIRHGLDSFLWGRAAVAVIGIGVHLVVAKSVLGLDVAALLVRMLRIMILCLPVFLITALTNVEGVLGPWLGAAASVLYIVVAMWLAERKGVWKEMQDLWSASLDKSATGAAS